MKKITIISMALTIIITAISCKKENSIIPITSKKYIVSQLTDTPYVKREGPKDTPYNSIIIIDTPYTATIADTPYTKK